MAVYKTFIFDVLKTIFSGCDKRRSASTLLLVVSVLTLEASRVSEKAKTRSTRAMSLAKSYPSSSRLLLPLLLLPVAEAVLYLLVPVSDE